MAIVETIPERFRNQYLAAAISIVLLLLVPGIMGKENWDDHDRSNRYTMRDFAYNYLESCEPNAVIFTNGDNDTFPLWYVQEVEGIRTDVRVCNLSYLAADWYIEQMSRAAYTSKPLPFSFQPDQYMNNTRNDLLIQDQFNKQYIELKSVMDFIGDDNLRTKLLWAGQEQGYLWTGKLNSEFQNSLQNYADRLSDFVPAKNLKITVDKEKVLSTGTVPPKYADWIVDEVRWTLKGEGGGQNEHIFKNSMMVLDLLAHNNWERPVYFAATVGSENLLNLSEYFQLDGLAKRFVPLKASETGGIDADKLYDKMMNQFRWGNLSDPKVYLCETNLRLISLFRSIFGQLADALIEENKKDSAVMALDRALEVIPVSKLPFSRNDAFLIEMYYRADAKDKGRDLAEQMFKAVSEEMDYFLSFPRKFSNGVAGEMRERKVMLYHLCTITWRHDRDLFETFKQYWDMLFPQERWDLMFQQEIGEE
jgi:hypothetical protein